MPVTITFGPKKKEGIQKGLSAKFFGEMGTQHFVSWLTDSYC